MGRDGADVESVSHGTTVATNQLLEGKVGDLGFITTEGYEFLLEIARQSVPDGYGNSYFWVKPPRIVPLHRVRTVGGRLDYQGSEVRPFDEAGRGRGGPLVPRRRHRDDRRLLPALVRRPRPRAGDARRAAARAPRRGRLDLQRGAAGVPRVRAGGDHAGRRCREAADGVVRREHHQRDSTQVADAATTCPVLRDEVQRRRAVGRGGRAPADHDRAVRAGRRRARRGAGRPGGRLRPGAHLRRRRHVHRRVAWSWTASRR